MSLLMQLFIMMIEAVIPKPPTVSELNLTTSAIKFDEAVDVSFGARIENNQPEIDTRLKLTTKLILNKEFTKFNLGDFVFTLLAQKNAFIAQEETIEIKSNIDVSMNEQRITLKQLQLSALGTNTLTDITVSQFLSIGSINTLSNLSQSKSPAANHPK